MHPTLGRMRRPEIEDEGGIGAALSAMADGLGRLFTESLALARLELAEDARTVAFSLAQLALFGVLLLVGYVLGCAAAAIGLAYLIGPALGFLVVAGVNLLAGGVGIFIAASSLKQKPAHALEGTRAEARETARELRGLAHGEVVVPARLAARVDHHEMRGAAAGL